MAKVTMLDGLMSISGKIGNTIYRTTASGKTIAYQQQSHRTSPLTEKELHQRKCFAIAVRIASEVLYNPDMQRTLEHIYKRIQSKSRPKTLRGFVVSEVIKIIKDIDL